MEDFPHPVAQHCRTWSHLRSLAWSCIRSCGFPVDNAWRHIHRCHARFRSRCHILEEQWSEPARNNRQVHGRRDEEVYAHSRIAAYGPCGCRVHVATGRTHSGKRFPANTRRCHVFHYDMGGVCGDNADTRLLYPCHHNAYRQDYRAHIPGVWFGGAGNGFRHTCGSAFQ